MSDDINWEDSTSGHKVWLKYENHPKLKKIWHTKPKMQMAPEDKPRQKKSVRIVAISDTHCHPLSKMNLPSGDILIHCGDMIVNGTEYEMRRVDREFGMKFPH